MQRVVAVGGGLVLCVAGAALATACGSPANCATQLSQWQGSGVSSELSKVNTGVTDIIQDPAFVKPATVAGWSSYLGGHQIPSCAATGLKNAYGLIQADLAFLKGGPTIFDKDLLSSSTSAGYDQGNQVTADATMNQQAIAELKGELPAGG